MSEIKLLPCPFCGSKDIALHRNHCNTEVYGHCNSCGASSGMDFGQTAERAAAVWNCRVDAKENRADS